MLRINRQNIHLHANTLRIQHTGPDPLTDSVQQSDELLWALISNTQFHWTVPLIPLATNWFVRSSLKMDWGLKNSTLLSAGYFPWPLPWKLPVDLNSWMGLGWSLNPERCKITVKLHLKTIIIPSWEKSVSRNLAIARRKKKNPPM